jgi:hypothetical protein
LHRPALSLQACSSPLFEFLCPETVPLELSSRSRIRIQFHPSQATGQSFFLPTLTILCTEPSNSFTSRPYATMLL